MGSNEEAMLWVQEESTNVTTGHSHRMADVYETSISSRGELYRNCIQRFGRCIGKIYIDKRDGSKVAVGWVFLKKQRYDDSLEESFLMETYITIHTKLPTQTIEYHYLEECCKD